ncbi:MAG: DUF1294 domain-containing protein [Crenarchaeota archaeon]|nr:DUF1294 domain-containing protein [Thermoproteota archaeon]
MPIGWLLAVGVIQEYLLLVNIMGFLLMGFDKLMAIQKGGRVSEKTFFAISAVGGPFGVFLGMLVFRHKTRNTYF